MMRQLIKANRTVLNIIKITVQCSMRFYSVTDILKDRPARLDRPESGTIRQASVRSSTAIFFDSSFKFLIGVQSNYQALSTKIYLYSLYSCEDGLEVRKPPSFPPNRSPKNVGTINLMFRGWFEVPQRVVGRSACTLLRRICSLNQSESENFPYKPSSYSVLP